MQTQVFREYLGENDKKRHRKSRDTVPLGDEYKKTIWQGRFVLTN